MSILKTQYHNVAYLVANGWTDWEIIQLGAPDFVRRYSKKRPEHMWLQTKVKRVRLALNTIRNLDVDKLTLEFEFDPTQQPGAEIYAAVHVARRPELRNVLTG
jgi:hypothetical protein